MTSAIVLVGCAGPGQFLGSPIAVEYLEGNYQSLASCTYKQLGRRDARLSMTDLRERRAVKISSTKDPGAQWELSFNDEAGGRQTRLEVTSGTGFFPGEHVLALVRACAA